jgi:uncharacterized membrane protein YgcG
MKSERGISSIVATVLIILGSVVLAGIVFFSVRGIVSQVDNLDKNVDLDIVVSEGYTLWDAENRLATIQVARGSDESDVVGFDMVFTFNGESVTHFIDDIPGINSKKTYAVSFFQFEGSLDSVKIIPVFSDGRLGNVVSELDVSDFVEEDIAALIGEDVLAEDEFIEPSGKSGSSGGSSSGSGGSGGSSGGDEELKEVAIIGIIGLRIVFRWIRWQVRLIVVVIIIVLSVPLILLSLICRRVVVVGTQI